MESRQAAACYSAGGGRALTAGCQRSLPADDVTAGRYRWTIAAAADRGKAAELAEVIIAGERDVDLAVALRTLAERGFAQVLAEGGPTLNGQLAAAGLLDEVCLTLSPLLVGGDAKRILAGPGLFSPGMRGALQWRLQSLCEQDGFLFLRYRSR
jgi:riboflavin biosynthesis pyrimidine reductase